MLFHAHPMVDVGGKKRQRKPGECKITTTATETFHMHSTAQQRVCLNVQ